jgi:hypothetical protein
MKKLNRVLVFVCLLSILMVPLLTQAEGVGPPDNPRAGLDQSVEDTGIQKSDGGLSMSVFVGQLIKAVLGLLGVIFIILIIYAGFLWMTSQGESDKIKKAKQILTSSIIGIIIILSAYIITDFIISSVLEATN